MHYACSTNANGSRDLNLIYIFLEDFNRRCLAQQKNEVGAEFHELFKTYFVKNASNFIHFDEHITDELSRSTFSFFFITCTNYDCFLAKYFVILIVRHLLFSNNDLTREDFKIVSLFTRFGS